jgi:hypothetical protein
VPAALGPPASGAQDRTRASNHGWHSAPGVKPPETPAHAGSARITAGYVVGDEDAAAADLAEDTADEGSSLVSNLWSRFADETGSWTPFAGRTTSNFDWVASRLEQYHGIDPILASERLHAIQEAFGLGSADNILFDRTGNVFDGVTGEYLGSLTEGGG